MDITDGDMAAAEIEAGFAGGDIFSVAYPSIDAGFRIVILPHLVMGDADVQ